MCLAPVQVTHQSIASLLFHLSFFSIPLFRFVHLTNVAVQKNFQPESTEGDQKSAGIFQVAEGRQWSSQQFLDYVKLCYGVVFSSVSDIVLCTAGIRVVNTSLYCTSYFSASMVLVTTNFPTSYEALGPIYVSVCVWCVVYMSARYFSVCGVMSVWISISFLSVSSQQKAQGCWLLCDGPATRFWAHDCVHCVRMVSFLSRSQRVSIVRSGFDLGCWLETVLYWSECQCGFGIQFKCSWESSYKINSWYGTRCVGVMIYPILYLYPISRQPFWPLIPFLFIMAVMIDRREDLTTFSGLERFKVCIFYFGATAAVLILTLDRPIKLVFWSWFMLTSTIPMWPRRVTRRMQFCVGHRKSKPDRRMNYSGILKLREKHRTMSCYEFPVFFQFHGGDSYHRSFQIPRSLTRLWGRMQASVWVDSRNWDRDCKSCVECHTVCSPGLFLPFSCLRVLVSFMRWLEKRIVLLWSFLPHMPNIAPTFCASLSPHTPSFIPLFPTSTILLSSFRIRKRI